MKLPNLPMLCLKSLAVASLSVAAVTATVPATAQVQGKVATASISRALLNTAALQNAFAQVSETYQAQIANSQAKQTQLSGLLTPFDSNNDGQISGNETAALEAAPNYSQIQTLQSEIATIENQITQAQVFAVEQVLQQYQPALTEVATQQQIAIVVDPTSLQYAQVEADITELVTTALNAKVPQVQVVPPANYRPSQNTLQIFQEIQRRILIQAARAQQQAAQQQQGNTEAPAGR